MKDFIYYNELYDIYKDLLTEKQRLYFEDYYFSNLSLSEMSENYDISRNAISKQLNTIRKYLDDYENKLALKSKKDSILKLIPDIKDKEIIDKIKNIIQS